MSRPTRSSRQRVSSIGRRRRLQLESLERRQLLAADLLFADSFEVGEWNGQWVEDSQNDWFRSTQRATDGSRSAEVDGFANNATLTLANPLDLSDYSSAELTFSWYIESNWDTGEYIAIDVFNGSWQEVDRLRGNVDAENTWHHETVSLDNYLSAGFLLRFRASVSDSAEDGNVDNVKIVGTLAGPPEISISDGTAIEGAQTTKFLDAFVATDSGGVLRPRGVEFNPHDGNLYVGHWNADQAATVLKYDGTTGQFLGVFADGSSVADETSRIMFRSGKMYVATGQNGILRFDAATGAPLPAIGKSGALFVTPIDEGVVDGVHDFAFGPNNELYVTSNTSNQVLEYDSQTGDFTQIFIPSGSGGMDRANAITLGSDGHMYVGSSGNNSVLRFQGPTGLAPGTFIDTFIESGVGGISWISAGGLRFGPNQDLYVSSRDNSSVIRFNGMSGDYIEAVVTSGEGGLHSTGGLTFDSQGRLYVASQFSNQVLRFGPESIAAFTVSLSAASEVPITVAYATSDNSAIAGSDYVATSGTLVFEPGVTSRTIIVQTIDDAIYEVTESFFVNLSNPVGATIVDGQAEGTILDDMSLAEIVTPNDPDYVSVQWGLNNTGQNGGTYDVDIDAPQAWTITTGSMKTVVAELDSGVPYSHPDIYLNIWLNQSEIPAALRADLSDVDGDDLITFRDLNDSSNASFVSDLNGTGYIDGGDLLLDPRWADGVDDDGNGFLDDLIGWDFVDNDNDPSPPGNDNHGLRMTQWIGGIPNNGVGYAGVNWFVSVMPIRIIPEGTREIDAHTGAAGLDYSVASEAPIAGLWGGGFTYSQVVYDAIDRARVAGQLVVAPIGNDATDTDVTPRYPASYDLDNIVSVTSFNANDGMDAAWNWGHTSVDLASPTNPGGGTSGGAANVAAVAALLKSAHPEWGYEQLKERILLTVEPSAALAGKTVTGGRLNAAQALGTTSISISDPSIMEGATGTQLLTFDVTRFGDDTGEIVIGWSTSDGTAEAGSDYIAASGQLTFSPGGANSHSIGITVLGDTLHEGDETLYINLTVLSGNVLLADPLGQAIILNDDILPSTKFYVVDDGSPDRTYEYGATGVAVENYSLGSGNTAPRGAASNLAGDKVWVVDANKKVYVYNDAGGLLGSWSANSLAFNATVEGIATNGTDVWIVDARQDRVYRYTNAASRLSGSQSAASSFALNSGNRSPKDIVTDGIHLWVVEDSTTDKVFKYTLSGSLVGSWTINAGGGRPTGITLDPSGANQSLWIVDSASDRVYEYANARATHSGSLSAAVSFALAAGNTNPQGIADPPAPVSVPTQSKASGVGSSAQLPSSRSFSPIVASGVPAIEPNRSASELNRSREMVRTLRAELPTASLATSRQSNLSELVTQSVRSESSAVAESKKTSQDSTDLAFTGDAFEWLDDALLGMLAHSR